VAAKPPPVTVSRMSAAARQLRRVVLSYDVAMSAVELPLVSRAEPAPGPDRATVERLARRARALSWLSLVWMTVEGGVALVAGIVAGSVALVGFGLDSAIEGFASVIIIWRFTGGRIHSAAAEERAQKLVAVQFFLLAPYVAVESVRALAAGNRPDETLVGILLACGSIVFMPMLGVAKQRIADQLGSPATRGEGRQNMLCAYLAGALLAGLLGNALFGAWWLDPIVGLLIAVVAVREGVDAWRGEGCCVSGPLPAASACEDDCCRT
jgi:divalent metal cation (Fe/Co/Zn/Cd) transporter